MKERRPGRQDLHTVRPRWGWLGLALLLVGLGVVAVAVIVTSIWWAVPGLVLVAAGAGAAIYGGLFYDIDASGSSGSVVADIREGTEHEEPGPDTLRGDARTRAQAADEARQTRMWTQRSQGLPSPGWSQAGGLLLLLAAVVLLVAQTLYDLEPANQDNSVRDLGAAVLLGMCGLRTVLARPHLVLVGVSVLVGGLLVLSGLVSDHGPGPEVPVTEIGAGTAAVLGGLLGLDRRRRPPRDRL